MTIDHINGRIKKTDKPFFQKNFKYHSSLQKTELNPLTLITQVWLTYNRHLYKSRAFVRDRQKSGRVTALLVALSHIS